MDNSDPDLIVTIFNHDAIYNDPKEPENHGHEGIKNYWISKVVGEQKEITFKVKNIWIDGNVAIAEWYAEFTDTKRNLRIKMNEAAILTIVDGKISSLREYYKTEKTPI